MRLEELRRVKLTQLPTPLEEMPNLSRALEAPRILIKRDDLTTLCFGGNKVRKLEFIMADAISKGADVIITTGGVQTNHGRLTVAAANKLKLKSVLVLTGKEPDRYTGNLLIDFLLGADIRFIAPDESLSCEKKAIELGKAVEDQILRIIEEYESKGHKCYIVPLGGRMRIATAGYLNGMLELHSQLVGIGVKADYLIVATGSTGTISSLILANRVLNTGTKVIGISVWMSAEECKKKILEELKEDVMFYGYDVHFSLDDITVLDDYIGTGYGVPSKESLEAIKLLAETESIIVDSSYTGKALAGLIDLIRKGFFKKNETIVFLHTGGTPAVFNLCKEDFERL